MGQKGDSTAVIQGLEQLHNILYWVCKDHPDFKAEGGGRTTARHKTSFIAGETPGVGRRLPSSRARTGEKPGRDSGQQWGHISKDSRKSSRLPRGLPLTISLNQQLISSYILKFILNSPRRSLRKSSQSIRSFSRRVHDASCIK